MSSLNAATNQFGIYLPNVGWDALPQPAQIVEYAVTAEELGFDSVWVEDRLLHSRVEVLESLTTLTFVASKTQRIRLGTSVLLVNLRNPLVLARTLSSLDYLSNGRVIAGVSLGGRPEEYLAAGVEMKSRVTRFIETLGVMRSIWGHESGANSLRLFQAPGEDALPGSVQRRIPLWIGGMAAPVLERVATLGDGWLASSTTSVEEFARGWAKIQELAGQLGRDAENLTPAKFTYIHVDDDRDRALDLLKANLPRYYDFPYDAATLAIYGPPDHCIERARQLLDSGVRTLIFSTVTQDIAQLNRLGRDVLPHLKKGN